MPASMLLDTGIHPNLPTRVRPQDHSPGPWAFSATDAQHRNTAPTAAHTQAVADAIIQTGGTSLQRRHDVAGFHQSHVSQPGIVRSSALGFSALKVQRVRRTKSTGSLGAGPRVPARHQPDLRTPRARTASPPRAGRAATASPPMPRTGARSTLRPRTEPSRPLPELNARAVQIRLREKDCSGAGEDRRVQPGRWGLPATR